MTPTKDIIYAAMAQTFGLLRNEPLKPYTSFKVGGLADLLALPKTVEELKGLLGYAAQQNIPVTLLGGGTNVLVSDKGIRGLVIVTTRLKSGIRITASSPEETLVAAEAGERLSSVCRFALDHSLSGLEFAAGIPGTLGGALVMNAGTKAGDMSGIIREIKRVAPKTLTLEIVERKNLEFSYRCLKLPGILVAATLALKTADRMKIEQTVQENLSFKKSSQPISAASAGCFFKNPAQGMPAGELIEKSGLKGIGINGARVSDVHANYIINTGDASCDDILRLKQHIQDTVFNAFKIKLETEVRIEGE